MFVEFHIVGVEDGFLDLAKAGILTSLGTSGYYKTEKIDNLPYAKIN